MLPKIKKIHLLIFAILFSYNLNAQNGFDIEADKKPQQSTTGKYRPDNVNKGIIGVSSKNQVVISDVPSYEWRHGCGPTALGMVIGYYDINGYPDLISGDASTQTISVNNAIANDEHYSDYSMPIDYYPELFQDKSELGGAHTDNCISDFMHTSWSLDENRYGWSYSNKISIAFESYISQQNNSYLTSSTYEYFDSESWNVYVNEINNNRPVVLLVDSDGDGNTDHFVTGIGYDDSNNNYAIYDTWDQNIHWFQWREMSSSYSWGIYGFNILEIGNQTAQVDLEPYTPNNINYVWDDKIIIQNTTVTNGYQDMHDDQIYVGDEVYFSFSYWNNSDTDIDDNFSVKILIDDTEEFTVNQTEILQGYYYWMWWNFQAVRTLTAGNHNAKIIVDANNVINEIDENNNEYS